MKRRIDIKKQRNMKRFILIVAVLCCSFVSFAQGERNIFEKRGIRNDRDTVNTDNKKDPLDFLSRTDTIRLSNEVPEPRRNNCFDGILSDDWDETESTKFLSVGSFFLGLLAGFIICLIMICKTPLKRRSGTTEPEQARISEENPEEESLRNQDEPGFVTDQIADESEQEQIPEDEPEEEAPQITEEETEDMQAHEETESSPAEGGNELEAIFWEEMVSLADKKLKEQKLLKTLKEDTKYFSEEEKKRIIIKYRDYPTIWSIEDLIHKVLRERAEKQSVYDNVKEFFPELLGKENNK